MQILLGILDSIRRGIAFITGSITSLSYFDAVYAPLANGSFFAFGASNSGTSTASYSYSTDGVTWSVGTLPAASSWNCAATNGSRIVAFRSSSTVAYYSDNGTTWTATNALSGASAISPNNALWDGTRFVITDSSTRTLRYSTDGITWSGTADLTDLVAYLGFDGTSRYITHQGSSTTSSGKTTNTFPTGWTTVFYPSAGWWGNVVYGNGLWLIVRSGSATYITSTTGTGSWTSRTLPSLISESANERDAKVLFNGGRFWYYYVDNVYSSADGINWVTDVTVTGDTLDQVNGWAAGPNKVIGVGQAADNVGSGVYLNGSK